MKKWKQALIILTLLPGSHVFAQLIPPGATNSGGDGTNDYPIPYIPPPYVPGLKLQIPAWNGSNLPINLLEADPAGKYDIYFASNLISSSWSDIAQGTNSQTNFTLTAPLSDTGFFRAARTDPPITNAANVTVSFASLFVNTNLITANVAGGPAAAMAVLINDTNFADAQWIPFSAVPYVLLGTNDGVYDVWLGFYGSDGTDYWTETTITLDTTPPLLVITNPAASLTSKPMIQLYGYSPEPLTGLAFTVTNSLGTNFSGEGLLTGQYFDTNLFDFTTNWFACLDLGLTIGTNYVSLRATDRANNVTITNLIYVFDTNGDTTPPGMTLYWPQDGTQISGTNFTARGILDDETATLTAQIVSTNGTTNIVNGLVERDGKFWVENLPLCGGSNLLTLTATDAAGNTSVTNICLFPSSVALTIDPPSTNELWSQGVTVTGTINDSSDYTVWVNGAPATLNGDGTWTATNVYLPPGGTAVIQARAIANSDNGGNGTGGSGGGPVTYGNLGNPDPPQDNDTETQTNRPPYLYVQSYNLSYNSQITGYNGSPFGIRLTKVNETISTDWTLEEPGSGSYDYFEVLDSRSPDATLTVNQSTTWPADEWPPTLEGTQTITETSGVGGGGTSVTNAGPPAIFWESCNIQGTAYYNYAGETNYPDAYTRTAKTTVRYFTGGKSVALRENLHQLNVAVNQQTFVPGFEGGSESTGAAITNGVTAGEFGTVGGDGNAWKVLPDGLDMDVTPQVSGVKNYNFGLSAQKYELTITANGTTLAPDDMADNASFCVGQYINFGLGWSPSTPPYVSAGYVWNLPGIFKNAETNAGPNYSTDPYVDYNLLTSNNTTAWWVSGGQPQTYAASVDATFNFANGQSVEMFPEGKFNMWRPQATVSTVTGNVNFGYNYYLNASEAAFALHFGNIFDLPPISPLGIEFPNSVTVPAGFSGSTNWLQVINSTTRRLQTNDVSGQWFGTQASDVLDDPVQFIINSSVPYDSPALQPDPNPANAYQTYEASDNFTMWLMFTPSGGHIVPLQKVNWHWSGTGELSGTNWVLTAQDSGADSSGSDTTDYPSWTNSIDNFKTFHPE